MRGPLFRKNLFTQEMGSAKIIERDMIQGQIATPSYSSTKCGTVKDTLCAIEINFNVSTSIIDIKKTKTMQMTEFDLQLLGGNVNTKICFLN